MHQLHKTANVGQVDRSNDEPLIISKSKTAGVFLKNMVSEIVLLLACNRKLIPQLITSNMISFLIDLRSSMLSETSKDHELCIETEINIA